jgi:hypothetical protein
VRHFTASLLHRPCVGSSVIVEEDEEDFCDAAGKSKRPRATRQQKRYRTDSEEQKKK